MIMIMCWGTSQRSLHYQSLRWYMWVVLVVLPPPSNIVHCIWSRAHIPILMGFSIAPPPRGFWSRAHIPIFTGFSTPRGFWSRAHITWRYLYECIEVYVKITTFLSVFQLVKLCSASVAAVLIRLTYFFFSLVDNSMKSKSTPYMTFFFSSKKR